MRIACLIKPSPPTIYYVNQIHKNFPVSLVVVEKNTSRGDRLSLAQRLSESIKTYGVPATLDLLADRFRSKNDPSLAHNEFFGDQWHELNSEIEQLHVDNINSEECVTRLKKEKFDVLLDHGTSIVRAPALDTSPLALNLHWGLSPYYRGVSCTGWALVNWDPYNIGVTMHKLAKEIDGGDIVAQKRATVRPTDDSYSIEMQLTKLGTDLTLHILELLKRGEELTFHKQDFSQGFVTLTRQWSRHWSNHLRFIEQNGVVAKMLKRPARAERLPIVELD